MVLRLKDFYKSKIRNEANKAIYQLHHGILKIKKWYKLRFEFFRIS